MQQKKYIQFFSIQTCIKAHSHKNKMFQYICDAGARWMHLFCFNCITLYGDGDTWNIKMQQMY